MEQGVNSHLSLNYSQLVLSIWVCVFGLSKKLLLNLFTEQGYYYLQPASRAVRIKYVVFEALGEG